jgi:hypothetical protein
MDVVPRPGERGKLQQRYRDAEQGSIGATDVEMSAEISRTPHQPCAEANSDARDTMNQGSNTTRLADQP